MTMNARGQAFSTDALLALIVFTLVLALTIGLLTQVQRTGESAELGLHRSHITEQILIQLLSSPGKPMNWETLSDRNQVKALGLIDHGGIISSEKWEELRDWNGDDYPSLKSWLGIADQNFYIQIVDLNRNTVSKAGIAPLDVNSVTAMVLPAYYDGDLVYVQLQVHTR